MKKIFFWLIIISSTFSFLFSNTYAKLGVGVGTGTIKVDEILKPGMVYKLPNLTVFNTGDEPSYYHVDVDFRDGQDQIRPDKAWFDFSPEEFYLEPGKAESVQVRLTLPLKGVEPGDYFAFLLGEPLIKSVDSSTSVGVAAAAKLYFTVKPANILAAVYYRGLNFWQDYYPWTAVVAGVVGGGALIITLKRLLGIDINVQMGKKKKSADKEKKTK